MISKILGGILLIIGTSIGAGMLGLPVATAAGGFFHSIWLLVGSWLATVFAAFLILEVNLWLPEGANLVSMAKKTLGPVGQIVTWVSYLLLLYSLIAAYIAGGTDLLHDFFITFSIATPEWFDSLLFTMILGSVVYFGIKFVDYANRGLMSVKMLSYVLLVALVLPHVKWPFLLGGHIQLLGPAVMVVMTSFGYATIIPSLRSYFNSRVGALRLTIFLGSFISLLCYILWDFAVQGTVKSLGGNGLIHMALSGHAASELANGLSTQLRVTAITDLAHLFTSICMTTSFLGVSLCLSDFFADGLRLPQKYGGKRFLVIALTFVPPLAIILWYPDAFLIGLRYAGLFCVILLMMLPALMAWSGRYWVKCAIGYRVVGGRVALAALLLICLGLLVYGLHQLV